MNNEKQNFQKVSIVIPVFNEAKTVRQLLESVFQQVLPYNLKKEIVIVESNSKDDSQSICQNFLKQFQNRGVDLQLILQTQALGKGSAVREGLKSATGDIILIQDADLEYDIGDYPSVIEPICEGHANFVLGSRHLSAGSWKIRSFKESRMKALIMNFGGWLFHTGFNILYGVKLTDPTTMFKVFRKSCIDQVHFESNRFDFDFELVAKLIRLGNIPLEVPISYKSRGFAEGKKVRMIRDPLTWVRAIIKYRFAALK